MTTQQVPTENLEKQYQRMIRKISEISKCEGHFRLADGSAAFAGTQDAPDLTLLIAPQGSGNYYYGITVGGESSSYESAEFPSDEDCTDAAAEFLAAFINRTVKFTRIQKRFSYIYECYQVYDEADGQWRTITETYLNRFLLKCFLWKNVSEEWEKKFSI